MTIHSNWCTFKENNMLASINGLPTKRNLIPSCCTAEYGFLLTFLVWWRVCMIPPWVKGYSTYFPPKEISELLTIVSFFMAGVPDKNVGRTPDLLPTKKEGTLRLKLVHVPNSKGLGKSTASTKPESEDSTRPEPPFLTPCGPCVQMAYRSGAVWAPQAWVANISPSDFPLNHLQDGILSPSIR